MRWADISDQETGGEALSDRRSGEGWWLGGNHKSGGEPAALQKRPETTYAMKGEKIKGSIG
jgi:hypothetical protein